MMKGMIAFCYPSFAVFIVCFGVERGVSAEREEAGLESGVPKAVRKRPD
jgi:hypothetical protein